MASTLYFGTDEGVVTVTSQDGQSWQVENHGLKDWSVLKAVSVPSAPNRVYAGTRGDGVWLSEDAGKTWIKPCYGKPGPGKVRCLTIDPHDSNTIYAGTEPIDVFVSRDSAKSWTRLNSLREVPFVETITYPVPTVEPHVRDIAVDPKDSKTIYVALQVGYMLKSTDGGQSWKLLDKGLDADVHTIVIDPTNTNHIFIATGGHDCRQGRSKGRALYMSNDAGHSWNPMGADLSQEYSLPLVMHPKNPKVLYAAMANGQPRQWNRPTGAESVIARTKDGGKSWQKLDGNLSELGRNFAVDIVLDETDPNRIYASLTSGDIYHSKDSGDTWGKLNVSIPKVTL